MLNRNKNERQFADKKFLFDLESIWSAAQTNKTEYCVDLICNMFFGLFSSKNMFAKHFGVPINVMLLTMFEKKGKKTINNKKQPCVDYLCLTYYDFIFMNWIEFHFQIWWKTNDYTLAIPWVQHHQSLNPSEMQSKCSVSDFSLLNIVSNCN